jgi:hypothetical protein
MPSSSSMATLPPMMREAQTCSRWLRASRSASSTMTNSFKPALIPSIRSRPKPVASSSRAAAASVRRRPMQRATKPSHSCQSGCSALSRACWGRLSATICTR